MMRSAVGGLVCAVAIAAWCAVARAQPATTSDRLHDANLAALAGDWPRVGALVEPLFGHSLASAELGEAHRLAGLAAFFRQLPDAAERHFVAYLRLDLDGRLDAALYPPDVVAFFNDVASRHAAELRALRTSPRRTWLLTLVPPFGQLQNGERTKAIIIGGAFGAALIVNLTTYGLLRAWCEQTSGPGGGALTCDAHGDHTRAASLMRPANLVSGIAAFAIYGYGVLDGIADYRRQSRESVQPYVAASRGSNVVGLMGSF